MNMGLSALDFNLTLYAPTPQRQLLPSNSLSAFDHFVGLALKG